MLDYNVPLNVIEDFLNGHDDEKYIVNLEYDYNTNLIYKYKHTPDGNKFVEKEPLKAFLWMKNFGEAREKLNFYNNNSLTIKNAMKDYGITITQLAHHDNDRLKNGYTHLLSCDQGYNRMLHFFKNGGIYRGIYDQRIKEYFLVLSPIEQYLMGTGKRLFKGYEEYDDLEKYVYDLETTGLDPNVNRIFLVGCKTNRGFEELFEAKLEGEDADKSEIEAIAKFFATIDYLRPSIIGGYNSANFDWPFIFKRCEILGIDVTKLAKTLKEGEEINLKDGMLKLGNEVEDYQQVNMAGYSIIDIMHSVRRAQAIDSDMKSASLKYVCKYNKVAKKNRVYIQGGKIGQYWNSNKKYYFDDKTGDYAETKPKIITMDYITREYVQANKNMVFIFGDNDLKTGLGGQAAQMRGEKNTIGIPTKKKPDITDDSYYTDDEFEQNKKKINFAVSLIIREIRMGKTIVLPSNGIGTGLARLQEKAPKTFKFLQATLNALQSYIDSFIECDGKYIVRRYLMDDLWETMEVDNIYNQTSFMLAKIVPTSYQRVSTMGTAGLWKLLMLAWSYEHGLAVPTPDEKRDFTGGLSRLLNVGYSRELRKMDFNSLYPAIQLAHMVFPNVDISGALRSMLKYFHSERFKAKALADKYKKSDPQLSSKYKRKQLPLKIFINSLFGAIGAPNAFPWAEMDVAEGITCRARQYLRCMVMFFKKKGYIPTVLDTDGVNFSAAGLDETKFRYVGKGLNAEVVEGKEYTGVEAVVAEFNDLYMRNEMALGLDGVWPATINLSRKNYALLEDDGKVKLTGNTVKSKKMPGYIEEFLDHAFILLLNGKGYEFVQYYYSYIEKIYEKKIPLAKIATKSKVRKSVTQYRNRGLNKNGKELPKQAHMELADLNKLNISLGDTIYYVNNGTKKGDSDVKKVKPNKKGVWKDEHVQKHTELYGCEPTGNEATILNCYYLSESEIETNPEKLGEYNVEKYINMFNKRMEPLLVVFEDSVRFTKIIKDVKRKNKETGEVSIVTKELKKHNILITNPEEKKSWVLSELELVSGNPFKDEDQDTIEELFTPSDKELEYWAKFGYKADFWFDNNIEFTVPGLEITVPL
jgi:DNA polymerase elongation subunit (family B)